MRPNSLITRTYLARGARLWIGARILASAAIALAGMHPLDPSFTASMLIIGISVMLGAADVGRRHERAFLENLSLSRATLIGLFAGPAILGELSISLAAIARG